jgi:hypothetical protein
MGKGADSSSTEVVTSQAGIIQQLQRQVRDLTAETIERKNKGRAVREEKDRLAKELEEAKAAYEKQLADLATERDTLKRAPDEKDQLIAELQGKIRTRAHKDAFTDAAKQAGVRADAIEAAWTLSGYKAESDTPDPQQITGAIAEAIKTHPFLHQGAGGGANGAAGQQPQGSGAVAPRQPLANPWDGGRGAPVGTPGVLKVRKSDLQDPKWSLDPRNIKMLKDARENGGYEVIDDLGGPQPLVAGANPFAGDAYRPAS